MSVSTTACGIDFGTSNSTVALLSKTQKIDMVRLEKDKQTLPSVIFFDASDKVYFGREAISLYLQGEEGRLLRSIKSILGTSLMQEKTRINKRNIDFTQILTHFIKHLKLKAEQQAGHQIDNVVMGRPVHFHDNNPEADSLAENTLKEIALNLGFKNIIFQLEPIAAAYKHEETINQEKLALVIDLGGGTSDFTVMRLSPNRHETTTSREQDILATYGIRVGGTNFDTSLSLKTIMPHLGMGSLYRDAFDENKHLTMPLTIYNDLSDWSRIYKAHSFEAIKQTQDLKNRSLEPKKLERLELIQEENLGYALLEEAEKAKIDLSDKDLSKICFKDLGNDFTLPVTRYDFETAISDHTNRIKGAIDHTLKLADLNTDDIDLIIMTGGSTELPVIHNMVRKKFPNSLFSEDDKFASVGYGLARQAMNSF